MKEISIRKAAKIGDKEATPVIVHIVKEVPEFGHKIKLEEIGLFYKEQAQDLYGALAISLPQGTMHQLLIKMLENHQNLYKGI